MVGGRIVTYLGIIRYLIGCSLKSWSDDGVFVSSFSSPSSFSVEETH